jgi:hypothetical protein
MDRQGVRFGLSFSMNFLEKLWGNGTSFVRFTLFGYSLDLVCRVNTHGECRIA